ncbi:hypothetical protein OF83DRAFT_1179111 [Amylostereum chailletii]|nr:hypothetical protein OF83DRAFT_1179111 [Amylostereum chailletii]
MAETSGSPLELSDAIDPDDYGIFVGTTAESTMTPDPSPHIVDKQSLGKEIERLVARANAGVKYAAAKLDLNTMSKEFIAAIKARDPSETCIFTGETANTVISWIFPPGLVHRVPSDIYGVGPNEPDYAAPLNAVSMRADLADHFLANNFGVDVDDNYRIRIFAEPAEDMPPLPDRLHLPSVANGAMDRCFKLHFRWCLGARTRGGDISEDYPSHAIRAFEETHCKGGDPDPETPLSDPVWNTVLGRAVLEDRLRSRLYGIDDEREDVSSFSDTSSEQGSDSCTEGA